MLNRRKVLNPHGVEHLTTESLGSNAGADALARGIDRSGGTRGSATDDEHIEWLDLVEALGLAGAHAGVELGDDLLQRHAALAEHLAVQVHRGDGEHLPLIHL